MRTKTAPSWMREMIDSGFAAKCGVTWLTYCVLRRHANPRAQMTLRIRMEQVKAETGLSDATVRRHLDTLKSVGVIERWYAARKGGGRRTLVRILKDPQGDQRSRMSIRQRSQVSTCSQGSKTSVGFNEGKGHSNAQERAVGSTSPTERGEGAPRQEGGPPPLGVAPGKAAECEEHPVARLEREKMAEIRAAREAAQQGVAR